MHHTRWLVGLALALLACSAVAQPLASKAIDNGVKVSVDWPATVKLDTPQEAVVTVTAPTGKTITRALVLVALNEATGSYVPTQPAQALGIWPDGTSRTLAAAYSPSWGLWPTAAFTDGAAQPVPGLAWPLVLGSDRDAMLPQHGTAVPFERPDEHDWVTLLFAASQGSQGLAAVQFRVPLVITKPDASLYVWAAAAGPAVPAGGVYIPASLASRAAAPTAATGAGPVVVTSPRNGDRVGPSVEIVGRATPGALIVIWTEVYKQKTGEFVEKVPGIRHKTQPDGTFHFRVATPRIFMGPETPLVYKLKIKQVTAAGESQPVTITLYPQR